MTEKSPIKEKLVALRRVTKVVGGGKNIRFSALVVVGNEAGMVGFATGKAREVPDAVRKASERAKKSMVRIPLKNSRTLHHDIQGVFGAARVCLRAAAPGTGIIAGGAMRPVFELLGLHDVVAKSIGTDNYHNVVRATVQALQSIASPKAVALKLGRKVSDVLSRRQVLSK